MLFISEVYMLCGITLLWALTHSYHSSARPATETAETSCLRKGPTGTQQRDNYYKLTVIGNTQLEEIRIQIN